MPQNLYELIWIFLIYAVIGWCTEVAYAALDNGKFVNRGFLNGPYCPIYGCGVVIVVAVLTPLKENLLLLFFGSFVLTSVLEFVTGYVLEKVFHNKWWDYSDKPFHIKGYVCLKFSIYWGLACTFIMDVIHPIIYKGITIIPHVVGVIVICILMILFCADICVTVATILKFNQKLKLMDEMALRLHRLSDEIGENIYENVSGVVEKSEEFQENHAEWIEKITNGTETAAQAIAGKKDAFKKSLEAKRQEYASLTEKYQKLFNEKNFGYQRLMKAFPRMISRDNNDMLQKLKKYQSNKKTEKKEHKKQKGNEENHD